MVPELSTAALLRLTLAMTAAADRISRSCRGSCYTLLQLLGTQTPHSVNRSALGSKIDGHPESPQVGHSRPANTAQRLNSVYVVASSD